MDRGLSVESLVAANTTGSVVDSHRWTSVSFFHTDGKSSLDEHIVTVAHPVKSAEIKREDKKMNQKHNYIELSRLM